MKQQTQSNSQQFSVDEVVKLFNYPVIKSDRGTEFLPENIGLIVGVLILNEQVEMVVKFIDRVTQFTKAEFTKSYRVIKD
jgi:hypothetical protein